MTKLIKILKWLLIVLSGIFIGLILGLIITIIHGATVYQVTLFISFILVLITFLSCILC